MVMIVAILVFSLVPVRLIADSLGVHAQSGSRSSRSSLASLLLPVVAGLAYEITVKWAGNHSENPFVRVLLWPGMQMQRMTTAEPDDSMVEVAVAAMQPIIAREDREARVARGEAAGPQISGWPPSPPRRPAPAGRAAGAAHVTARRPRRETGRRAGRVLRGAACRAARSPSPSRAGESVEGEAGLEARNSAASPRAVASAAGVAPASAPSVALPTEAGTRGPEPDRLRSRRPAFAAGAAARRAVLHSAGLD